ncbi:usg protein [Methylobrevis pamukkalensis]|uniref:Usg-like family protein n=1 Tax=Methylobrevis pamukkalensis TaxID=1439726 RepID=A0A1E3H2V6_9HYPH|nr:usg protein [Methylobrevis pamukkalensis]ODN70659.1 Usg-like family protein [Methylobrevis pamukkalensis]
MVSSEFRRQLQGYGLTTANILYHLPDHPAILQSYVWQQYDLAPEFPELKRFLDFWHTKLDGPLHSVEVGHLHLIGPRLWRKVDADFLLH